VEQLRTIVLATGNAGKAREFGRLLAGGRSVEPLPAGITLPEETGQTFAANALLKAEWVFAALGGRIAVLADDSGLEVSALGGRPGVLSARFAGPAATDQEKVARLLDELGGCDDRAARFVCCLCLLRPGDRIQVEGVTEGVITSAPRGEDGFGYDPVFQPLGWEVTLAEAAPEDKDRVSHRGAAARTLLAALEGKVG
jgi:XTP/dITP diphosphohydrolase